MANVQYSQEHDCSYFDILILVEYNLWNQISFELYVMEGMKNGENVLDEVGLIQIHGRDFFIIIYF